MGGATISTCTILLTACIAATAANGQTISFTDGAVGKSPANFEFGLAGDGGPGRWEIVTDETAAGGKALAQLSADDTANRFLIVIYQPTVFANGEVSARCKPIAGKADQACGVIIRASDPKNCYIARSNALESNVRFYRVRNGERQQLATAENVPTARGQWHTITLRAEGNRYTVSVDGKPVHQTTDATTAEPRPRSGRAGLWVKSDSVSHFDRIEIKSLP